MSIYTKKEIHFETLMIHDTTTIQPSPNLKGEKIKAKSESSSDDSPQCGEFAARWLLENINSSPLNSFHPRFPFPTRALKHNKEPKL